MARITRALLGVAFLAVTMIWLTPTPAVAAVSGLQAVMVTGCSTGATIQFAMGGNTTASLPCASSTAAQIQTALSTLPGLGSSLIVSGTPTSGAYMLSLWGTIPLTLTGSLTQGGNALTAGSGPMPGVAVGVPAMIIVGGAQPLPRGLTIMEVTPGSVANLNSVSGCANGGLYTTTVNGSFVTYDSTAGAAGSTNFMAWYPGGVIPQLTPFIVSCR